MPSEHTAIRKAYEEGMSPEEIALDRELDVAAVKAVLIQCSKQYRKDCGMEEEGVDKLNFSDEELSRINETLMSLALSAENEGVRLKAAMYVRDDKKGRRDVVRGIAGQQNNIFLINQQMQKVREIASRVKESVMINGSSQGDPINV